MSGIFAQREPDWVVNANLLESFQKESASRSRAPVSLKGWATLTLGAFAIAVVVTQMESLSQANVHGVKTEIQTAANGVANLVGGAATTPSHEVISNATDRNVEILATLGKSLQSVESSIMLRSIRTDISTEGQILVHGEGSCRDISVATAFRDRLAKNMPQATATITSLERTDSNKGLPIQLVFDVTSRTTSKGELKP